MTARLPPLNWLRAFDAAARNLSFTAAAEELNMTQSAVSQQIKSLEGFLGRPLFIRKARGLELTNTAQAYLPTVDAAFKLLAEGTQNVRGVDQDQVLEIRSNLAFSVHWLAPRLPAFLEANPWVNLNITTVIWPHHDPIVPNATVEVAFAEASDNYIQTGERLIEDHFYPICTPEAARRLSNPADLLEERLLDVSGIVEGWDTWFRAAGHDGVFDKRIDLASTYVVTFAMAKEGQGVAMAHGVLAEKMLASGEMVRPFDILCPLRESYYLMPPRDGRTNAAAEAFRAWLKDEFKER